MDLTLLSSSIKVSTSSSLVQVQHWYWFTSTETIRLIWDGEPRTATSTFTQLLSRFLLFDFKIAGPAKTECPTSFDHYNQALSLSLCFQKPDSCQAWSALPLKRGKLHRLWGAIFACVTTDDPVSAWRVFSSRWCPNSLSSVTACRPLSRPLLYG